MRCVGADLAANNLAVKITVDKYSSLLLQVRTLRESLEGY